MAYNPVPTVATGDLWTASNHNTYIRDNFAAGVPDIFTAAGDLAIASGANAASNLPVGSTGQMLQVVSGLPAWVTNPVLFASPKTNSSWDGDSKAAGSTTIAANTFHADLPNSAKALLVGLHCVFDMISTSVPPYVNIYPVGTNSNNACCGAWGDTMPSTITVNQQQNRSGFGIVELDSSGEFNIYVYHNRSALVFIYVWGYIP